MRNNTAESSLPLLGLTCFNIATKFEDIDQPSVENLCQLATRTDVEVAERDIKFLTAHVLEVLNFDVQYPTTHRFFEKFSNIVNASEVHRLLGQFILEIALLEIHMIY
jgi:hypothetical protein